MGYPIYPPELEIDVSSCKCVDAESRIPPLSRFLSAKEADFTDFCQPKKLTSRLSLILYHCFLG